MLARRFCDTLLLDTVFWRFWRLLVGVTGDTSFFVLSSRLFEAALYLLRLEVWCFLEMRWVSPAVFVDEVAEACFGVIDVFYGLAVAALGPLGV